MFNFNEMNRLFIIIFLMTLGFTSPGRAEDTSSAMKITIGMYPMGINGFDTHGSSLKMNFYTWYQSINKEFNPAAVVEILNSPDATITSTINGENSDKRYFTTLHYQATIDHDWDFRYYPFDRQNFKVIFEAAEPVSAMVLEPDRQQSNVNDNIKIENWNLTKNSITPSNVTYNTNFGDDSSFADEYSRVTFSYEYQHEGWRIFFNLYSAFFVCAIFCIMTNFFSDPDIRVQLILTAVIGFIGNKYIVDGYVPEVSYFTLSDAIQGATFATMLLALAGLLVELYIPEKLKKSINITFALVSSIGYTGYVSYQLISALSY